MGEEAVCVCFLVESLGGMSIASARVMFATHHADPISVEGDVTPVGLYSDDASIEAALPDVRITATSYRTFSDKIQILLFQPAAGMWEGSSEFLSRVEVALG